MIQFFLRIFDYFQGRRRLCMGLLIASMGVLVAMMASLTYNENIYDFLPISGNEQKAITLYQDISGGQSVFALFEMKDSSATDDAALTDAVDCFAERLQSGSGKEMTGEVMTQVDFDKVLGITDFIYQNIPLMLVDSDYVRMERLLSDPDFADRQLATDVQMLMMPATGILTPSIAYDPLELFSPAMTRLQARQRNLPVEIDDGYLYTPGHRYAVAVVKSPFGAMESAQNSRLVSYVDSAAQQTMDDVPEVKVGITGSPVIAVGNAARIKADSQWAISIAVTLILLLLVFAFRKVKHLLLIGLAIVFGWLFAMGFMAVVRSDVSLIVLGIGSIIIGIAVNYPLHFIAHTDHGGTAREVLKDMVAPLLIGNITTVGAFASLIPLDAPALRDLGLFAAFMLVGTILFVLLFLPHLVKTEAHHGPERLPFVRFFSRLLHHPFLRRYQGSRSATKRLSPLLSFIVVVLTLLFGWFSLDTSFDTNMQHINYMNAEQKELLSGLHASAGLNDTTNVYLVAEGETWEEALNVRRRITPLLDSLRSANALSHCTDVTDFVCSTEEQQRRIDRWNAYWAAHRDEVLALVQAKAPKYGFSATAFSGFAEIVNASYTPQPFNYFEPVRSVLLSNAFSTSTGACSVVDVISVERPSSSRTTLETTLNAALGTDGYAFDFTGMNSAVAKSLSNDFNYIGFACGFIVFLFLWLSFGRLELSLLAFLPMAVGWIWILGIMRIFGIEFNIVNVILATFIFGQGDDYTIFMTEGLISEYAYRKKVLPSFKNSIIVSALIMFIGMGSLIVARHPALHSLAEVTIVGMFTVVLMAFYLPPYVFHWITHTNGKPRRVPVTIEQVIRITYCACVYLFQVAYGTVCGLIAAPGGWRKRERELWMHRVIQRSMYADITHIWGVPAYIKGQEKTDFSRPSIILCNHQSLLDPIYILALDPRIVIVIGDRVWRNPIVHHFFRLAGFLNVHQPYDQLREQVSEALSKGYSVCIFPEGLRTFGDHISRFHKGAFNLARALKADIQPIFLHGTAHIMTRGSAFPPRGRIDVEIGTRVTATELDSYGETEQLISQTFRHIYQDHFRQMCREIETTHYYHDFLIYKYMYKGIEVERETRRLLKHYDDFSQWIDGYETKDMERVNIINAGRGQFALLFALVHPEVQVHSYASDRDDVALAAACTSMPANLHIHHSSDEAKALATGGHHIINLSDIIT